MPKKILFCPIHPTSLETMLHIASSVKKESIPIILVSNDFIASVAGDIESRGLKVYFVTGSENVSKEKARNVEPIKTRRLNIVVWAKNKAYGLLSQLPFSIIKNKENRYIKALQEGFKKNYVVKQQEIKKVFDRVQPDVVIVAGDRHLQYEVVVNKEARSRDVPVIIPPISSVGSPKGFAANRLKKAKKFYMDKDGALVMALPEQFFCIEGSVNVAFYPLWQIKPLVELGLLPKRPFVMGGSMADTIMVSGDHERARLIRHGLEYEKIEITGDPEFDDLYVGFKNKERIREKIIEKYCLFGNSKIVVISLPQLYEHKLLSYDEHWEVINHICSSAGKENINTLVSLHPKMKREQYVHLQEKYSLVIIDEPLREVLPVADVFIASQGSSTWLWAVMCEIPTLLTDWYGLNYDGFIDQKCGVEIIKEKQQLAKALLKLLDDGAFYEKQKLKQRERKDSLALFDGQAMARIRQIICQ